MVHSHSPYLLDQKRLLECERSAMDVSTGYGADSFLTPGPDYDPWARRCFQVEIDILVNSRELYYPFPTKHSMEHGGGRGLSQSMRVLEDAGLLLPAKEIIAENEPLLQAHLNLYFQAFVEWSLRHRDNLRVWIDFHSIPRPNTRSDTERRSPE